MAKKKSKKDPEKQAGLPCRTRKQPKWTKRISSVPRRKRSRRFPVMVKKMSENDTDALDARSRKYQQEGKSKPHGAL
jgi:hypothetical protein